MAEVSGEFPKYTEAIEKKGKGKAKGKTKKLKRKLKEAELKLKFQSKLNKERLKCCKMETELKFTKLLLQGHGTLPESFYILNKRG